MTPRWSDFECAAERIAAVPHERGVLLTWHTGHLLIVGEARMTEEVGAQVMIAARPEEYAK